MSPQKARIRDSVVNALIGALAALFVTQGVPGVWRSKETVAAHNADMQVVNDKLDRAIDLLCAHEPAPQPRACSMPSGAAQVAQR